MEKGHQNKILEGAKELFFMYGLKRVTVDDICRHIGMSKKTLYLFFKNKEELIFSLININSLDHDGKVEANKELEKLILSL